MCPCGNSAILFVVYLELVLDSLKLMKEDFLKFKSFLNLGSQFYKPNVLVNRIGE